jgi:hypothetical protein
MMALLLLLLVIVLQLSSAPMAAGQQLYYSEIFVDPVHGDDGALGTDRQSALRTLGSAQSAVQALRRQPGGGECVDVTVHLMPGVHHVGQEGLVLGPEDGGCGGRSVTWRSAEPSNAATLGAPLRVTRWKPHPTKHGAFSAPLPPNVSKGDILRHFWVNGKRAERPRGIPPGQGPRGPKMAKFNLTM